MARKQNTRKRRHRRGGANGHFPAQYFNSSVISKGVDAGHDITNYTKDIVRPALDPSQSKVGGFVPSIGEPFALMASKYITPLALYSGYRLLTHRRKPITRRARKSRNKKGSIKI